ncbi:ABC transporter ATP-binding protein [Spirochaeta cellobiosiphila]|uniref:ATP-binding cassette domain-containing protein n=1 Tax=Spirochaeta cellobiosiphila TaxID=504483 RepID=UPI00041A5760|nr:ABC transporter ATP-binding protein [Spirochaeta cellobiosiphila]
MLEIKNLSVKRGDHPLFINLSCEALPGDVVALSGSNGCGKTSLFLCIAGSLPYEEGRINIVEDRVSFVPDNGGTIPLLSVVEQLSLQCLLSGLTKEETRRRVDQVIQVLELDPHRDKRGAELSLGLKKRLGIALGIIRDADVFLFDEPFSGLDYLSVQVFYGILQALKEKGKIAVVSSHSLTLEEDLFNRRWVVRDNRIIQNPDEEPSSPGRLSSLADLTWLD